MGLPLSDLTNILLFMERVPCTGKEALAWAQSYAAVQAEIKVLSTPPVPQVPA